MKPLALLALAIAIACPGCGADSQAAQPAAPTAAPPSDADTAGIRQAALDYIEGWYAGDGDRMARAVHPQLAKRIVRADKATGKSVVDPMTADELVGATRKGYGKQTPAARQEKEVTILDVFENAATAKVVAADFIDYLHLAKVDGRWVIINVLWELKPRQR